jgi:predicted O-linked N-acetylglucosamine transferase (SPINDLY family)
MATIPEALAIAVRHHQAGRLDAAEQIYRQVLAVAPHQADAWHLLGVIAHQAGRHEEAVELISRAVQGNGTAAAFHNNLGEAYRALRSFPAAVACYRRALDLQPDYAEAHNNLGIVLQDLGEMDEALACFRHALDLNPDSAEAHNNLGNALRDLGRLDESLACCRRSLDLNPDNAQAHNNLGNALKDMGMLDEAIASFGRALDLKPDYAEACNNLGNAFNDQAKLDEALACYRRALDLKPDFVEAHDNLVYTRLFCPASDAQTLCEEHRRWNDRHAAPLARCIEPHGNDRSPHRRLRIGYVSPDFRDHVVGRNLLPLFRRHDRGRFEIFAYADVLGADEITRLFRSRADAWRMTVGLTDAELARHIREDRIDILVDLTLHLTHNRLLVFARKPAPVQVTFAGYPGSTGLTTMDYRLTDPHLDPPGLDDRCYAEESIRLPNSFWCYDPLDSELPVNALPAATSGCITFGCLNNFCKINPPVLRIWARVLKAVDRSRLVVLAGEGAHRRETLDLLADEGVQRDRVVFVGRRPRHLYLKYFHDLDIGLDTVPYNGHTTSLDSLWMGVPVVTLTGRTVVGRAGACQLMNLGLPELVAGSPGQFVRIAAELAGDLPRLSALRATLRDRMQASPLMDAPRFAQNIEAAYSEMWRRWCAKQIL